MKIVAAALGGSLLFAAHVALAQAPSWLPPPENQRCPSRWGPNDERGSMNRQNAAAVMNAAKLIRTGEVIEIGHVLRVSPRSYCFLTEPSQHQSD